MNRQPQYRFLLLLAALPLAGCDRDDIKVYRVEKPQSTPMAQAQMPGGHPGMMPLRPKLVWQTPAGWTEAAPGAVRVASFNVKVDGVGQADVSVIPLGGSAGGDLANVNRWREQVGLSPVSAEELQKMAVKVEIAGQPAEVFDFTGTTPSSGDETRLLAAIQHRDGTAWFFKMVGDAPVVSQHKDGFLALLKSIRFEAPDAAGLPADHPPLGEEQLPAGHPPIGGDALPAGHPPIGATPAPTGEVSAEGKPQWSVPAGWTEVPGGQFLAAKFNITGDGAAQASVNVSRSSGDGGGLAANLNRWRQQLGLPPLAEAELAKTISLVEAGGRKISLVEMAGTDARTGQPAALAGAVVPQEGETWFYKLMGDATVVAAQKDAFNKFVEGVKY